MVSLRGEKTEVYLWKVIGNVWKEYKFTIRGGNFMQCSSYHNDLVNFADVQHSNIIFHVVNEMTAKWSQPRRCTHVQN